MSGLADAILNFACISLVKWNNACCGIVVTPILSSFPVLKHCNNIQPSNKMPTGIMAPHYNLVSLLDAGITFRSPAVACVLCQEFAKSIWAYSKNYALKCIRYINNHDVHTTWPLFLNSLIVFSRRYQPMFQFCNYHSLLSIRFISGMPKHTFSFVLQCNFYLLI